MISVRNLSHDFDARRVLSNINLEIAKGEIVAIMGSSGGGKTTLLRCISGLIRATKGEISVDGIDVLKNPEEARNHMGMVFQSAALFDYMSVQENILFGVKRRIRADNATHRQIVNEALKTVGLSESDATKMPSELSGGMRKRVGLARALALKPAVMLYDEPTTGLDPVTTYTIDALVSDVRNKLQITSLVVSHDVTSVIRTADRVAFLHAGELIFNGTPDQFESSNEAPIIQLLHNASTRTLA